MSRRRRPTLPRELLAAAMDGSDPFRTVEFCCTGRDTHNELMINRYSVPMCSCDEAPATCYRHGIVPADIHPMRTDQQWPLKPGGSAGHFHEAQTETLTCPRSSCTARVVWRWENPRTKVVQAADAGLSKVDNSYL